MIHVKWILLCILVLLWAWACWSDLRESDYLTGLIAAIATLIAIILGLVWYIVFF
jgi:hypothetical protein